MLDHPQLAQPAEDLPLIDQRVMDDWCGDLDKADVIDLLSRVPAEGYICLTGIKDAAGRGDLAAAKRMAHRLKGMAGNLGAARLARMARSIEITSVDIADVATRSVELEKTFLATLDALKLSA